MSRFAILSLAAVAMFASPTVADERPNIVVAIADDWSWPHASAYGDPAVKTPAFDRVAAEGAIFAKAFCAAPSCTPSRGALLTGRVPHRLGEGGNLWSRLDRSIPTYPDILEAAGYAVGLTGKGWGPGSMEGTGRPHNPAGPPVKGFAEFLDRVPAGRPFCYWFGGQDPHRPYEPGFGRASGIDPAKIVVPGFLPDTPAVRDDIADYLGEIERFDRLLGAILDTLDARGLANDTIVVVTSDNGMPFPRAKANLYDAGTRVPLAVRWPARIEKGSRIDAYMTLTDLAPTLLDAAGLAVPEGLDGRSLLPLWHGDDPSGFDRVFVERERHANVRAGDLGYPARALRTADFLYVRNLAPDRWPAGDPTMYRAVGDYGDIDGSPSKDLLIRSRDDPKLGPYSIRALDRRPAEELYDLANDPDQLANVADEPKYASTLAELRAEVDRWRVATDDPTLDDPGRFDRFPYYGQQRPRP